MHVWVGALLYEPSIVKALFYEHSSMIGDKEHKIYVGGVFEAL